MRYPRLRADLDALAGFGRDPAGGYTRRAYTAVDLEARRWLVERMEAAGLRARLDPAGNVIGRLEASNLQADAPALIIGSHIDTVPNGGWLDGALGVLAGLEVARHLQEQAVVRRTAVEVVAFEDEEGRFGALTGSRAMLGELDTAAFERMRDADGVTLQDALAAAGLGLADLPKAARPAEEIAAYLELHVEQGPTLEREGISVGIVDAIAGQVRLAVRFEGRADHAGGMPMDQRHDAFAAAALFATRLRERVVREGGDRAVMTVGIVKVEPDAGNIVPYLARLGLEIRDTDEARLNKLAAAAEEEARNAAEFHGVTLRCRQVYRADPVPMNESLREILGLSAEALGIPTLAIPSRAGHDALVLGRHVPSAMLFVPSCEGRSHCPEETTDWKDIEDGVDTLYEAARRLVSGTG